MTTVTDPGAGPFDQGYGQPGSAHGHTVHREDGHTDFETAAKQAVVDDVAYAPKHVMHTLDKDGDQRIQWDHRNDDEVAAARTMFDTLKGKGYLAYKATEGGGRGEQLRRFDAAAEHIVLVKPLQGG